MPIFSNYVRELVVTKLVTKESLVAKKYLWYLFGGVLWVPKKELSQGPLTKITFKEF